MSRSSISPVIACFTIAIVHHLALINAIIFDCITSTPRSDMAPQICPCPSKGSDTPFFPLARHSVTTKHIKPSLMTRIPFREIPVELEQESHVVSAYLASCEGGRGRMGRVEPRLSDSVRDRDRVGRRTREERIARNERNGRISAYGLAAEPAYSVFCGLSRCKPKQDIRLGIVCIFETGGFAVVRWH